MKCEFDGNEYPIMIRPKVIPIIDTSNYDYRPPAKVVKQLTDTKLEEIRRKLIQISHQGIALNDGLQIGLDPAGRPLIYDAGRMCTYAPGHPKPFQVNDNVWMGLLGMLGKLQSYDNSDIEKYGFVTQDEHY